MGSKLSEKVTRYRKNIKNKMILSMGGKCQCCGYSRCNDALEFHHIDPTQKELAFGQLRSNPKKISSVLLELKKCILLCSICHREIHAGIRIVPNVYCKLDPSVFGWREVEVGFEKIEKEVSVEVKEKKERKKKFEVSRDELKDLLDIKSMVAIGKMFEVSDNAVRKRAKKFGLL